MGLREKVCGELGVFIGLGEKGLLSGFRVVQFGFALVGDSRLPRTRSYTGASG